MVLSSEPVAGKGVADRQHEEGEPKRQHEQVQHSMSFRPKPRNETQRSPLIGDYLQVTA